MRGSPGGVSVKSPIQPFKFYASVLQRRVPIVQDSSIFATASALNGSLAKNILTVLSAVGSAFNGSLIKKTLKSLAAVVTALNASMVKKTLPVLSAASAALNGSLVKKILTVLSAVASAFNGSLVKKSLVVLAANVAAFGGSIVKKTSVILSAAASAFNGSMVKKIAVVLFAIASAPNGDLAEARLHVLVLSAIMTALSGSVIKKASVILSALSTAMSGSQNKKTSQSFIVVITAFSGALNKFTRKFLNAVSSVWNAIVTGIKQSAPPVPPSFQPIVIGRLVVSSGLNANNPAEIDRFSQSTQIFSGLNSPFSTADNWAAQGQRAMGGQLLVAPGNGSLSGRTYQAVIGGIVTIPASASGMSLSITLFQNYFSNGILVQNDPLGVVSVPVIAGQSTLWSMVCELQGNGRNNGALKADAFGTTRY